MATRSGLYALGSVRLDARWNRRRDVTAPGPSGGTPSDANDAGDSMSTDFGTALRAFATATTIAAAASFTGCGSSEEGPPPDPVGTITTSVNYTANQNPIELYKGIADDGPYAGHYASSHMACQEQR